MPERYGPAWQQRLLEPLGSLRMLGRRALLALLGIAMGCAAVVALLNIGHNAQVQALSVFKDMGTELLVAHFESRLDGTSRAAPADLDGAALLHAIPALDAVAPIMLAAADLRRQGREQSIMVLGSRTALAQVLALHIAQGRFLSPYDAHSTYAVLGATLATQLGLAPGSRLQLGGYIVEVVGVLAAQGDNPLLPFSLNESVLVPLQGMRRLMAVPQISTVLARARPDQSVEAAAEALRLYLDPLAPGHQVGVQIPRQLLAGMAQQSQTFSWLLGGVGAIALLMGGVGVMNVMVMSVSERRREIGVRMALGARPRDIGWLFLAEALVLSVAGAVLGAVFGVLSAWAFVRLCGWRFALSASALPLGMVSSVLVGLFFGLQPALAAARLQPVQALRDD